jgi:nucleoside phosphorylase/serine/threonine protein kinase
MKAKEIKGKVDFGIITIRDDEFAAVLKRFHPEEHAHGERLYGITQMPTISTGRYVVATVRCVEQGTGEAQNVANDLINDLDPNWILLVGIGGGVPASEFTLGDVVAATRLHDFCIEATIQDRSPEYSIAGGPMHKSVQTLLAHLTAMDDMLRGWNAESSIGMSRPGAHLSPDTLYGDSEWREKVSRSITKHFGVGVASRQPIVTSGSVASSDRLIKDSDTLKEWQQAARHIQGIEMELAGVYRAARTTTRDYPVLAIRGISDIVGFKRDDIWLEYACNTAAAFSSALLKATPTTPRNELIVLSNPANVKAQSKPTRRRLEDDYEVDHIVFAGHYSRVFKCRKRGTNEICIVKETNAHNVCLDALHSLKDLRCPNVAAPREIWESEGKVYEELPYIGGVRLSQAIIRGVGGLTGPVLESFHLQLMRILRKLHDSGIVHRDIHPDNVYLVVKRHKDASYKVVEEINFWDGFGYSRYGLELGEDLDHGFQIAWVLVDCTFATLIDQPTALRYRHGPYTDEDQESGISTPASDMYALGATMFYGITGDEIKSFRERKKGNDYVSFPDGDHPSTRFANHLKQLLSLNPRERLSLPDLGEDTLTTGYVGTLRLSDEEVIVVDKFASETRILQRLQAVEFFRRLERWYEDRQYKKDLTNVRTWISFLNKDA